MAEARGLSQVIQWALVIVFVVGALEVLSFEGILTKKRAETSSCQPDDEGQYSIGIFKGPSPFELKPVEQWDPRADTSAAWPVANPIYTCANVKDVASSFVADPFLWPASDKEMYLFYETKSLHNMQGDIGAAQSKDGGLTWEHVGVVLDEPWHLSYPFLVQHNGKMYMLPEGSKSGVLNLYRAESFPSKWVLDRVLINEPLIDASPIQHNGRWYMFASNRNRKSQKGCREMEIWHADDFLGPWSLHPLSPVKEWVQGSRSAGRPVVVGGKLYRFAQDCGEMYGRKVRAYRVDVLDGKQYEETEVPLGFNESRQGEGAWNGVRYHHIDAHQMEDGQWVAVMDGDRYVSDYLTHRWLARLKIAVPTLLLIAVTAWYVHRQGGLLAVCGGACCRCKQAADRLARAVLPQPLYLRLCRCHASRGAGCGSFEESSVVAWLNVGGSGSSSSGCGGGKEPPLLPYADKECCGKPGGKGAAGCPWAAADRALSAPLPVLRCCSGWQLLAVAGLLVAAFYAASWLMWHYGRFQVLKFILWYIDAWGGPKTPIAVAGQLSKFSILVMSYEARMVTLKAFAQHYGQCASVGEIVVVWNKGTPPDPTRDLHSKVPLRVRAEAKNSMNNRFQPDPELTYRGVLMLDDDLLMPCADIERAFAAWREHPERVTGFYARLLEGDVPQYQCSYCESHTYDSGQYNIILAGASFLDRELVFDAYFSEENKAGREYVDRVFNCDDLLLNYLMAHKLKGAQYVQWVRPSKRFDVGKLTSARLSTGNFGPVRHKCTQDFAAMFGNPLANKSYPLQWGAKGKPVCGPSWLGCLYLW